MWLDRLLKNLHTYGLDQDIKGLDFAVVINNTFSRHEETDTPTYIHTDKK